MPKAIKTNTVATAMTADNGAAQGFQEDSPTAAATYPKPARKLNQRTKLTILPASSLFFKILTSVLPPTAIVTNPNAAAIKVANYVYQTSQFAQTTLRSVLGEVELDELLSHRDKLNLRIQTIIDQRTEPFGVKVTSVEVKQVDLPEQMLRAMAKQAEAEREKRSKIIHAEGEFNAAQKLVDAAALLATEPITIQLRYLQTLTEIGVEKNTTIIFPLPIEFMQLIEKFGAKSAISKNQ